MRPDQVTAYGADYSAREFTPEEMNRYPGVSIGWLARYIGYPGNRKCISYYPGAYKAHTEAGRPVALYHQVEYRDFEGGEVRGRAHAQTALADARSQRVGWSGESPIIACFDRRMPGFTRNGIVYRTIPLSEVREYMNGFRSVLGTLTGFYGFEDTMGPCIREGWATFTMQCGARSAHIPGITAWQENNVQPLLLNTATDRLELYKKLSEVFGGNIAEEGFLMALDEWKQERMFSWVESMAAGVQGQNFDGVQFAAEKAWHQQMAATLDAHSAVLKQIAERDDRVTLDPVQLAALSGTIETRVQTEIDELEAAMGERLDAMAASLSAELGVDESVVLAGLRKFYGYAVNDSEEG